MQRERTGIMIRVTTFEGMRDDDLRTRNKGHQCFGKRRSVVNKRAVRKVEPRQLRRRSAEYSQRHIELSKSRVAHLTLIPNSGRGAVRGMCEVKLARQRQYDACPQHLVVWMCDEKKSPCIYALPRFNRRQNLVGVRLTGHERPVEPRG
jgi:hypothetical protein